jgi:hypothetical protein
MIVKSHVEKPYPSASGDLIRACQGTSCSIGVLLNHIRIP